MLRLAAVLGALCALASSTARADFFSSSPGPLAAQHAALDDKCQDCHTGLRALSPAKCLACHKPIAERQAKRRGVHGSGKALDRPCQLCHSDHKGRGADILGWVTFGGKDTFDHSVAGWPLEGKHHGLTCARCHTQKTSSGSVTYLKATPDCGSCHKNPHGETRDAALKCERCHDASSWKAIDKPRFNHQVDTRYPILGKHEGLRCVQCHAARPGATLPPRAKAPPSQNAQLAQPQQLTFRWRSWSTDCTPCHDNVHGASLFGKKRCALCHSAKVTFPTVAFDHDRNTAFHLDGAHADRKRTTCVSCHKKDERVKPDRRCETCHEDVHRGRFEKQNHNDCARCHSTEAFRGEIRFPHGVRTRFRLDGAHASATCRACHLGATQREYENFESLVTVAGGRVQVACMGCHQHEKVHDKQYTSVQCLNCHKSAGVKENKTRAVNEFHGPASRFPLVDGHKGVKCAQCHPNDVFKDTPLICGPQCHSDDLHKGTLGTDCLKCHEGAVWSARHFNHDVMTRWPLVGHHRDVRCESCHKKRNFADNRGKETTCYNCHRADDVHAGGLGTHCETCHDPTGRVRFDHNDPKVSNWPLDGKHQSVACAACHPTLAFKPTPRACEGCHPEPAVHKGQLGTRCNGCHSTPGWKTIHTEHDLPAVKFGGAHDRIPCARCHIAGRALAGTGSLCITCHRSDDIHHNTLGPNCGDCHTQRSFAGGRFEHTRVGCELTGVHRLQPCSSCHIGGNFTALAPICVACHRGDARRATAVSMTAVGMMRKVPNHDGFDTCTGCHNANFFVPRMPGDRRESVCR